MLNAAGFRVRLCSGIAVVLPMAVRVPAFSQEAAGSQPQLAIEQITVTARKKEESLQDVPLSITAFSAEEIDSAGITSLDDVAAFTPGLTFSNLQGEFLPVPVIRGIAPTAVFGENNAAVFIDGVFVSGREGLNAGQLDLERIEVLKGPQSTKYGRNAFAGAINYVTARPTDELQTKAEFILGNYEKRSARVAVSGPLAAQKLSGRLAIGFDDWAGSYSNNLSPQDIGGYSFRTMQSSLWWTPKESVDVQWVLYLSDDEIDPSPMTAAAANCEDRVDLPPGEDKTRFSRPQNFCGTIPDLPDNILGVTSGAVGEQRNLVRSSLHVDWDMGFGTLVALTGYSKTRQNGVVDGLPQGAVPFVYFADTIENRTFLAEELVISPGDETTEVSQELRFNSTTGRGIRYEMGLYFYDVRKVSREADVVARLANSSQRLPADFLGFQPAYPVVGDAIFLPWFTQTDVDRSVQARDDTRSWSVFGGVEIDIGERWIFDAGLRFDDTEKELREADGSNAKDSWDYWTGRAGLKFNVTEDWMIYTSVANGKKSGGFDSIEVDIFNPNGTVDKDVIRIFSFDVEKNTTYELGAKGSFLDRRGTIDFAVFYTDWTDILIPQIFSSDPETGERFDQPTGINTTGGDATVVGFETSLRFILTENWDFSMGLSWTDAEFTDAEFASFSRFPSFYVDADGDGRGDGADLAGHKLLRQSPVQGNFTLNYRRPFFGDWDWFTRTDVTYQDAQWVGVPNQAKVPAHTYVNLRTGIDSERYRIELWAKNLLDDDNPVSAFRDVFFNNTTNGVTSNLSGDLFPFKMSVRQPTRRTLGVTARIKF